MNKKPATRPVKSGTDRRRRIANQRKRLVALGVSEEKIGKLTTKDIRRMLRSPLKTAAMANRQALPLEKAEA